MEQTLMWVLPVCGIIVAFFVLPYPDKTNYNMSVRGFVAGILLGYSVFQFISYFMLEKIWFFQVGKSMNIASGIFLVLFSLFIGFVTRRRKRN